MKESSTFIRKCDKFMNNSNLHYVPSKILHFVISPLPLYRWGMDILGPFLLAPGQLKLDRWGRLFNEMDRGWGCHQDHNIKGSMLLLAWNHLRIWFSRGYHFWQWYSFHLLHWGWFLLQPRIVDKFYFRFPSTGKQTGWIKEQSNIVWDKEKAKLSQKALG